MYCPSPSLPLCPQVAIATLNFLYVDNELGRTQLTEVQETLKSNLSYRNLYQLTVQLLDKGGVKSAYHHRDKKKKTG